MYHTIGHIDTHATFSNAIHARTLRRPCRILSSTNGRRRRRHGGKNGRSSLQQPQQQQQRTSFVRGPFWFARLLLHGLPNPIPRAGYKVKRPLYYRHLIVINARWPRANRPLLHALSVRTRSAKPIRISLTVLYGHRDAARFNTKAKSPAAPPPPRSPPCAQRTLTRARERTRALWRSHS